MGQYKNSKWWSPDYDFAWDHIKTAMKRDWEQAKRSDVPNTSQNIDHIARQTGGMEPIPPLGRQSFEEFESACRFGYGARLKFGGAYPEWDNDLEINLARDWRALDPTRQQTWGQDRSAIRYGWNFEAKEFIEHTVG
jgi:hypothetical protein